MNWAVELRELSKEFPGGKRAVDSVSVRLEPGQVFGFLGPNVPRYEQKTLSIT